MLHLEIIRNLRILKKNINISCTYNYYVIALHNNLCNEIISVQEILVFFRIFYDF